MILLACLTAFFLLTTFFLTVTGGALRRLRRSRSEKQLELMGWRFYYYGILHKRFPKRPFDVLLFAHVFARGISRFLYTALGLLLVGYLWPYIPYLSPAWTITIGLVLLLLILLLVGDLWPRVWAIRQAQSAIHAAAPISSFLLLLFFPISYPFLWIASQLTRFSAAILTRDPTDHVRDKIIEVIQDSEAVSGLDADDKKLIESAITFRDRIVREVMVPRVDVFCLPSTTPLQEAAKHFLDEGYSRIPVYEDTVDQIVGVLMHKDILQIYSDMAKKNGDTKLLEMPIASLAKKVLYTPETKKVSDLLQELRKKKTHIAIVVDEYGGTAGIVTIEDVLELIVGEIDDEYDIEEEALYTAQPKGGWVVDGRMSILDIEEELGIRIPQEAEYDTIGGYIFHRAGAVPPKGLHIHHDDFELEILSSSERAVEKIRITPRTPSN